MTAFPDTTSAPPPVDHPYASALWLLGRHRRLARLALRIPGLVAPDDVDGRPTIDMEVLTRAVHTDAAAYDAAWADYERHNPPPADRDDERAYYRWEEAGPKAPPHVHAFGVMSSYEKATLRLFAVLNAYDRVPLHVGDFQGGDSEYRAFVKDLLVALWAA